jgi:N-acylneuraminate cytidylyltransferase
MNNELKIIAIIPARGESKERAGLNVRPIAGKPLLAYAIEAARSSPLIQRVIVTTDHPEIASVAKAHGAETPFLRPPSSSDATTESALQHAVLWLDKNENYRADIVVFLTATSVLRQPAWVNEFARRLVEDPTLDSAFVAHRETKNFWRRAKGSWVRLAPDIAYASRATREPLFREETPAACATRADLIRQARRVGPHVDLVITDDKRAIFSIQTEFDFWLAEKILAEWPMSRPL